MLTIISPAKSLDFDTPPVTEKYTIPELLEDSEKLADRLKKMSPSQLSDLMGISKELGQLNFARYQKWKRPFTPDNAKQAVLAFNGDVYQGLDAETLPEELLEKAQKKLRILSGLYGVLKPLDLIQPYRLEMGTKMEYGHAKDLYGFWDPQLTQKINEALEESGSNILVNLASNEYFKSIGKKKLDAEIITPVFKDLKNGNYKIISFFAKKARGLMTRFILENGVTDPEELPAFEADGYHFNPRLSKTKQPVFTREQ